MLPGIPDYTLPGKNELPEGRVDWRIDPDRSVVLVHDMQRYFVDAFGSDSPALREAITNMRRIREAAKQAGVPVYFTAQPPSQKPDQRGLLWDFWGPGIQDDGRHVVVDDLQPVEEPDLITKWRYDAFVGTDLKKRIVGAGRDQLIVTGIYAHIGCLMTAASAFMNDIQPFFAADATADFSAHYHSLALTYAAERCAVVLNSDSVISQLAREK